MPWCPKCKNEYEKGITVCADCGCELEEEASVKPLPVYFGSEEEMSALKDFLVFNKLHTATVSYDEKEDIYEVCVLEKEKKPADRLAEIFRQQKAKEQTEAEENKARPEPVSAAVYQNSAEKAEDNRSSAYTLLGVGGIGLIVMILGMTGVLPLIEGSSKYVVYSIMSALFVLFVVMGAVSMKSSRIFARKAESENSLRGTMEKWCRDHLIGAQLDEEAFDGEADSLTDEAKYFKRTELMKKKIQTQFMNLDMGFLEQFTDEIYGDIFEE